jgi:HK97 family phage portal protein
MKLFSRFRREQKSAQFKDVLRRLVAAHEGALGAMVTPETCMQSPTVHAIITAVSRRLSVTPIHVYRKGSEDGRDTKEKLGNHPVARLLQAPNNWQTRVEFMGDAASVFMRWGRFHAYKSRGMTGPIRELIPLHPTSVEPKMDTSWRVTYRVRQGDGEIREYEPRQILNVRGPARDFFTGDSPVKDVAQAIALEILAEKFGASFFRNGALPLVIFKYMAGVGAFKTQEEEDQFVQSYQDALGGDRRFRALLLPKGIETGPPIPVENDKAQFLETRKYQRTVIAGAFGVPPHLVGDLERATFNNVEQQDQDFTLNVVMPVAQAFEASMERDLLTPEDRSSGVVIRFNLDSVLRADFKSRQEGLQIQRRMGVISANEWREIEGRNPRESGNEYWDQGPQGQGGSGVTQNEADANDTAGNQAA